VISARMVRIIQVTCTARSLRCRPTMRWKYAIGQMGPADHFDVGHFGRADGHVARHGRLMRRKDSPGSVSGESCFERNQMKGGGHERRRKTRTVRTYIKQKIFEAGVQRADKRAGSFSFLTWSFFIAPLIACEEFLAAMFKSAAAVEEDAKTAQAGRRAAGGDERPSAGE